MGRIRHLPVRESALKSVGLSLNTVLFATNLNNLFLVSPRLLGRSVAAASAFASAGTKDARGDFLLKTYKALEGLIRA